MAAESTISVNDVEYEYLIWMLDQPIQARYIEARRTLRKKLEQI